MEPTSRRIPGSDGLELHLLEWSQDGVPMILIHGFGNEAHIWDDFAPSVAEAYRVIAIDQRGHGESDWDSQGRYDYENLVADLEAVIDGQGFERVVLVGHSLGGRVSMLYAGRHPEKVAGFVIVDSAPELDPRGTIRIRQDVEEHRDPSFAGPEEYERYLSTAYPAAKPAALRRMAQHALKQREDGRYELKMDQALRGFGSEKLDAEAMREREERHTAQLWEALEKTPCPTLVVRGAASDIVSADVADRMAEEVLPNGSLAVVGQAGHSVMTDNPDGFREAVCEFVLG
jgi:pimeloyl-ACP methyl ester carboxylesterase